MVVLTCVQEIFTEHCKGAESKGAESCPSQSTPCSVHDVDKQNHGSEGRGTRAVFVSLIWSYSFSENQVEIREGDTNF